MTRVSLRPIFPFIIVLLITLAGFAQEEPSAKQEVDTSPVPANTSALTQQTPSKAPVAKSSSAQTAKQQDENAVVSKPDHRFKLNWGGITVGAGYSRFSGPALLPLYYPYGWGYRYWSYWGAYSPLWWDPWWYPYGSYPGYGPADGRGEVKLQVEPKRAEVLIDGAYAGTVASLKSSLWLDPGAYDLCVKAADHSDYCRRIYVLSGKKLEVHASLAPVTGKVNP
jgi:hypothetical protein